MLTDHQDAARRRLLNILDRRILEDLSGHDKPHTLSRPALLTACVEHWNEPAVRAAIERKLKRADTPD
jgi:hypothetical protein